MRYVTDVILSVMFAVSFLLAAQTVWPYVGAGLDTGSVGRELEKATSHEFTTVERDRIGSLQSADTAPLQTIPEHGELFAYMYVPRFGMEWTKPVQEGADAAVLDNLGVGHYEGSVMPGQVGNSAYAGHATVNDFGRLTELEAGDQIIIRGTDDWYVYEMTEGFVVESTDTGVVADSAVTGRGLTLTTCYPMFTPTDTGLRYIVHGTLIGWMPIGDGVPEQLAQEHETTMDRITRTVETVSEKVSMPVTGVLALSCLAIWLVLDGFLWVCCHRPMIRRLRESDRTLLLPVWLWRIQAGPVDSRFRIVRILAFLIRLMLLLLLCAGVMFALWRWACPLLADTFAWAANPHPDMG